MEQQNKGGKIMTTTKQPMLKRKRNLKPGEIIPLKFDEAFKMMYANPKYMEILTLLISRILKVDYAEIEGKIELAPTSIPNHTLGEVKSNRDIVVSVRTSPEYKIIMEINIRHEFYQHVINRNLYYAFQMSGGGLEESKNYEDMNITYQVNFNNFFADQIHKPAIDLYNLQNKDGYTLTDYFKVLHVNIEECYRLWYNKSYKGMFEPYEEDLLLLSAAMNMKSEEEFNSCLEEVRTRPEIIELMEKVIVDMTKDEEMWGRWYNKEEEEAKIIEGIKIEIMRKIAKGDIQDGLAKEIVDELKAKAVKEAQEQGHAEGIAKGRAEGRAEGRTEGMIEGRLEERKSLIQKMVQNGLNPTEIATMIEVNEAEVQKILENKEDK